MSHIIRIASLIDRKENVHFGFEGFDLESKKLRYFSFIQNGKAYENQLFEFKINNVPNTIFNRPICFRFVKRESFSSRFPSELQFYKDTFIEKHESFNKKYNLPLDFLEKNKSFLSIQYNNLYEIYPSPFDEIFDKGCYYGISNQILLYINNRDWNQASLEEKKQTYSVLLHELGHMKASRFFLNTRDNKLIETFGLSSTEYFLIPILLSNGDIFYKIDTKKTLTNSKKRILEEMINELECRKIDSTYRNAYPNYGKVLNELCDERLQMARYTNGIDEYYERMTSIIPNESLACELLDLILQYHEPPMLIFETTKYNAEQEIQKLIREYTRKKEIKKL